VVGTNIISGNVGLAPGATSGITGFPPAIVTGGGAIIATGGETSQARLDLITAEVGLAGMPANVNLSNTNLGGLTLPPGVYKFNGAAFLTGDLKLDAQGQNHAFWVFQMGTTLITSVGSSVKIINTGSNGGSDDGVFWNAGSGITIGLNNQILGNYLAGTSVTFSGTTHGAGRALALAAVTLDNNVVNSRGGPAGSDWTGGLKYDLNGNVVPLGGAATLVLGLPVITKQPEAARILAFTNIKFHVVAKGPGPLKYVWERNMVKLKNGARVYDATTSTLILRRVLPTEGGNYRVVVSNAQGSVTSISVKLSVTR